MKVYTVADFILSSLGKGTDINFTKVKEGVVGIEEIEFMQIPQQTVMASRIDEKDWIKKFQDKEVADYTRLELQFILAIRELLKSSGLKDYSRLLLMISTTKGNIDLLQGEGHDFDKHVLLPEMARRINDYFHFPNKSIVVSNACISGVSAILTGRLMIEVGHCDHVLAVGGDLFSHFVYSGFQSFMALTKGWCAPFDRDRDGINLGEAVAGILLSNDPGMCRNTSALSAIVGGGQANDANHISGPSREGLGLKIAIGKALKQAGIAAQEIDYINAHGTATVFNDEMEAKAFSAMSLGSVPLNSLKGYYGHTLGAAGILESILAIRQLNSGLFVKSMGYNENGVSVPLHVLTDHHENKIARYALKTASGFGGGNAAIIFEKP